jgi:hypothetical protein
MTFYAFNALQMQSLVEDFMFSVHVPVALLKMSSFFAKVQCSAVDPELFFVDPDPTFQLVSDPEPVSDPT